jgi:hypothetical protein
MPNKPVTQNQNFPIYHTNKQFKVILLLIKEPQCTIILMKLIVVDVVMRRLFSRPGFYVERDEKPPETKQVHSCRSEHALAQIRCEIKAEDRGDGSKKMAEKSLKTDRIWSQ